MSKRTMLALGGGLGCLVLLLCVGAAALAGYSYYNVATKVSAPVDRIAYVDNDMNILTVDAKGEQRAALTSDASEQERRLYMFPTWSPDSRRVAFVGFSKPSDETSEGTLNVAPATGGNVTTVFKSDSQFPFYLYWSPDSQRIAFLAQTDETMSLLLGRADGSDEPHPVQTGEALYWAWALDGQALLLHHDGGTGNPEDARLALVQDGQQPQIVSDRPGAFQAPDYTPNGKAMLYASKNGSEEETLYVTDANGTNPQPVASYTGTIAFAWSPNGKRIATLATPDESRLPVDGPIFISDADGKNRKQMTTENALAFYWSPDSERIAFLTLVQPGEGSSRAAGFVPARADGVARALSGPARTSALNRPMMQEPELQLRWRVLNLANGQIQTLATFVPTEQFISLLPFFDQYARSLTFWSPDSQHFVYTQSEADETGTVWVADLAQGAQPHRVGEGTLAVWSWK